MPGETHRAPLSSWSRPVVAAVALAYRRSMGERGGAMEAFQAARVVALRGLDLPSVAVLEATKGGAGRALRHQRRLGTVKNPHKEGRLALWELAG